MIKSLCIAALCFSLSACATIHRHPTATKLVIIGLGAVAGASIAKATEQNCPSTYEGKPYQGTPPCPK
jgi:hypothetical protein